LFDNLASAARFLQYLKTRHPNINFTIEFEENHEIPFLAPSGTLSLLESKIKPNPHPSWQVFSNFNPFPSSPSKATGDRKQFQYLQIVFNNKPRPLVLEFN